MTSFSPEDQAIRIICTKHFHRALWLSETANHSKLKVTYSTTTNFDSVNLPAILFIGPMFGTRWNALHFDKLARDCGRLGYRPPTRARLLPQSLPSFRLTCSTLMPVSIPSSTAISYLAPPGPEGSSRQQLAQTSPEQRRQLPPAPFEQYGFDEDTAKLIEKLSSKYQFAESTTGANDEVKLCLRKCDDADWGEAADYSNCIRKIAVKEAALGSRELNVSNWAKIEADRASFGQRALEVAACDARPVLPSSLSEDDGQRPPSAQSATASAPIRLFPPRGAKSVEHRPRKTRSLELFDILKRDYSDLIDRDSYGKLHSTSFHWIKELAQSMSEREKEALKEDAVDPAVAMSHLYVNMLAEMTTADEINSETPIEGLFILKRGNSLYYHGTSAAKRFLDLQHDEYIKGNSNNIF
ncbi:hypothetical protein V1525DRAFT_389108 [Lipomyces kononenkoae]|uniref:Uncharacterized protein n=1 Tax=Lipomyces kononenkoae TaxID=34357 RepID=A0ACC3SYZ3_LIPKO